MGKFLMRECKMQSVLITGASRGLGLGFTEYYLAQGFDVVATCRAPKTAKALQNLKQQYTNLSILPLDIAQQTSIVKLAEQLADKSFHLIINNAGISPPQPFETWTQQGFYEAFTTNTIGPALVSRHLHTQLHTNGKLIQISSGMGSLTWNINPTDALDAYAASKAALNMLTRRMAEKLKEKAIIVIALNPGWVKTDGGGPEAPMEISEAISLMTNVINQVTLADSGNFFAETGELIPW